ncbi:MAG TPA: MFS transporter [Steroidobacteraceae bacterium]|nr:MFS transporter [Steroidobacteraceae bacterium]
MTSRSGSRTSFRSVIGGSLGNLVEWFDWYAYSAFTIYFANSFFPAEERTAQLLKAAAIFSVGFLMRPLGAWVLGAYADRHGRKSALTLSVSMMALGALLIAITPTYATIGVGAPGLLMLARILQGFSTGGEYGASATYMSEVVHPSHRGLYSGVLYATLILGQLLALAVLMLLQFLLLTRDQLHAWGWRIPFALGALIAIVALLWRRRLPESELFERTTPSSRAGRLHMLKAQPRAVAMVVGLTLGGTLYFYTFTTYMQKFLVNSTGLTEAQSTWISSVALLVFVLMQPLAGAVSDRIGRRTVLIAFGSLATLTTVPLLLAVEHAHSATSALMLVLVGMIIASMYSSVSAIAKAELFPIEIRALGVGLPYAVAVSVFGGSAETIALWLKSVDHAHYFYFYVSLCAAISLFVYWRMPDSRVHSQM